MVGIEVHDPKGTSLRACFKIGNAGEDSSLNPAARFTTFASQ
jgi:hypothetical protein